MQERRRDLTNEELEILRQFAHGTSGAMPPCPRDGADGIDGRDGKDGLTREEVEKIIDERLARLKLCECGN